MSSQTPVAANAVSRRDLNRVLSVGIAIAMLISGTLALTVSARATPSIGLLGSGTGSGIDVLLRSNTLSERHALSFMGVVTKVDYGGLVLATVPSQVLHDLQGRGLVVRILGDRTMLYLGSIQFDTAKGAPDIAGNLRIDSYGPGVTGLYLVQFIGPVKTGWVDDLKASGARLYNYVPNFAFIVSMDSWTAQVVARLPSVQWVGIYQPAYRISQLIYRQFPEAPALSAKVPMGPLPKSIDAASASLGPDLSAQDPVTKLLAAPGGSGASLGATSFGPASAATGSSMTRFGSGTAPSSLSIPSSGVGAYDISVLVLKSAPSSTFRSIAALSLRHYQTMDFGRMVLLRFSMNIASLPHVAGLPGVYWIEPFLKPALSDEVSSQIVAGNINPIAPGYMSWLGSVGVNGTGVTVAVDDTGVDTGVDDPNVDGDMHPELDNRVVANIAYGGLPDASDGFGHGTHTSGIVAGNTSTNLTDSNGFLYGLGVAPAAKIVNQRIFDSNGFWVYPNYTSLATDAYNNGALINSNSWGISDFGQYIVDDAMYDALVRDADPSTDGNQQLTFEFSAGNSGSGSQSTGSPGNAKNVITTGASLNYRPADAPPGTWPADNIDAIVGFSSRGPTADGRIKPDLVAPGTWVASLLSSRARPAWCWEQIDQYHEFCGGTSMSGPMVSGGAALFVEYYRSLTGVNPSPAITKAALVNGAIDMPPTNASAFSSSTGPIPNMDEGWGRLDLGRVVASPGTVVYDDQEHPLNTGDTYSYQIVVGLLTQPFKVSVAWTDVPGTPGAATELVNDLDLVVTAPDGTTYLGNNFENGFSSPGGTADAKNNLENVYIDTADLQVGPYTVTVTGVNVPSGPQDYALVVSYGGGPTSNGQVFWNSPVYRSSALAGVLLMDLDLNVNNATPDTATVTASSDLGDLERVTVTEIGNNSAVFTGSIELTNASSSANDGVLSVVNNGTITVTYVDASPPATKTANATIDDNPPIISGVAVTDLRFNRAIIHWTTNEPGDSVLYWGTSIPPGNTVADARRVLDHTPKLRGLTEGTTYYFAVQSTDQAGNTALDNNNTAYYQFTTPSVPATPAPNEEWPTFHNNLARLGASPSPHTPPINQQWVDGPHVEQIYSGPVLADGILFSTALDGSIRARDPYSGTLMWERTLGGQFYYTPTPAVDNGAVFVAFASGSGAWLYALDELTGDTLWVDSWSDTGLQFSAREQLAVADGMVFGAARTGEIFAVNETTGSIVWTYQTGALPFVGVTVAGGLVFHGTVLADTLYALDEMTGTLEWRTDLDNWIGSTPVFAAGNLYVGTLSGTMYSLDAFAGTINWQVGGLGGFWFNSPAYDGAAIYFGSDGGNVYSLDAFTGDILWQNSIFVGVESSPALANGFLYLTAFDNVLRTFDTFDGSIVDNDYFESFFSASSPAISDGWIWVEDFSGNIYGFSGQLAVGALVQPAIQISDATPSSSVDYRVNVKNVGLSGPDTFDATNTTGAHGWAVDLFQADGITPLADTDGDSIPDTGSLATGSSVDVVIRVTVPAAVSPGDKEISIVSFTSSNDITRSKSAKVITTVPPPGVSVGPRGYFPLAPGDTVSQTLTVRNKGGFDDVIDITAVSSHGWAVALFKADGVTPLPDTDGDKIPDVGSVPGLRTAMFVARITVPAGVPFDTVDKTVVTGTSSLDPTASGSTNLVIEIVGPPSPEWPQFHHDRERGGVGPVPFEMPLTQRWVTPVSGLAIQWTGSVIHGHTVFVTSPDGILTALDLGTGSILWSKKLGQNLDGFGTAGTPAVGYGNVYVVFVTNNFADVTLFALNEATGALKWRVDSSVGFAFRSFTTVVVAAGNVYWNDFFGDTIHANDALTGAPLWTYSMPSVTYQGPTYWGGMVFATDGGGSIVALDAFTGARIWSKTVDTVTSAPSVVGGVLYVGDYSGTLYALDALSGDQVWAAGGLGALIDVSSPVVAQGLVFVGTFLDFFGSAGTMYAVDEDTGAVVWSYPLPGGPVGTSAAYNNGTVFLTTWDGNLWAWDATTGAVRAQLPLSDIGSTSSVALGDGYLIVGDQDGEVTGFSFVGAGEVQRLSVAPASKDVVVGTPALFNVKAYDGYDNNVGGATFTWESAQGLGAVLEVSDNGDRVVYIAGTVAGTDNLVATANGISGSANVNVIPGSLDRIEVAMLVDGNRFDAPVSIPAGSQRTFVVVATDRYGNTITGASLTWGVLNGVGTIDANGVFTASHTLGVGFVTSTHSSGKTGQQQVTIVPAAPATLDIALTSASVSVDSQSVIAATVRDAYGNANPDGEVRWTITTGTGSILLLTPDGRTILYHAPVTTTPASVQLTATLGGISRTITLTLVAGPPVGISIDAPATTVAVGGTLDFGAVVTDQYGNAVTGATIAWKTTAGSINQQGVFTAPSNPGLVVITASTAGRESFVVIEVTSGGFEQFSRQATSATSLVLLLATIVAVASSVFLFVRYRESKRELEEMRRGRGGAGGGSDEV